MPCRTPELGNILLPAVFIALFRLSPPKKVQTYLARVNRILCAGICQAKKSYSLNLLSVMVTTTIINNLKVKIIRVRAKPPVFIYIVNLLHFFICQFKIKDVYIFINTVFVNRFGNCNHFILQIPTEYNLGR